MPTEKEHTPFASWCILELMGHRRLAGYVTEQEIAGVGLLRLDVPGDDGTVATQFYHPSALYCLTPTTEETARAVAKVGRPAPVQVWELPAPKLQQTETVLRRCPSCDIEDEQFGSFCRHCGAVVADIHGDDDDYEDDESP